MTDDGDCNHDDDVDADDADDAEAVWCGVAWRDEMQNDVMSRKETFTFVLIHVLNQCFVHPSP